MATKGFSFASKPEVYSGELSDGRTVYVSMWAFPPSLSRMHPETNDPEWWLRYKNGQEVYPADMPAAIRRPSLEEIIVE